MAVYFVFHRYIINVATDIVRQTMGGYAIENYQNNLVQNSHLCNGTEKNFFWERNFSSATIADGCFLWCY